MQNLVAHLKANPVQLVAAVCGLILLLVMAIGPAYFITRGDPKAGIMFYKNIAAVVALLTGAAGLFVYYARQKGMALPAFAQLPPELTDEGKALINRQALILSGLMLAISFILFVAVR